MVCRFSTISLKPTSKPSIYNKKILFCLKKTRRNYNCRAYCREIKNIHRQISVTSHFRKMSTEDLRIFLLHSEISVWWNLFLILIIKYWETLTLTVQNSMKHKDFSCNHFKVFNWLEYFKRVKWVPHELTQS